MTIVTKLQCKISTVSRDAIKSVSLFVKLFLKSVKAMPSSAVQLLQPVWVREDGRYNKLVSQGSSVVSGHKIKATHF